MKAIAHSRYVRVTPQKARRIMREVRGLPANRALDILKFAPQKPAVPIRKALVSALANAEQAARQAGKSFDTDEMFVVEAYVNDGPTMKRFRARAQGRGARILKRTSHLTVVVGDAEDQQALAAPWKKETPSPKTAPAKRETANTKVKAEKASKPAAKTADKPAAKPAAAKTSKSSAAKSDSAKKTTETKTTKAKTSSTTTKAASTKKAPAKTAAKQDDAEKGAK